MPRELLEYLKRNVFCDLWQQRTTEKEVRGREKGEERKGR